VSWKTPITLLVLLGVLLGAAYYGWKTIISPATGDDNTSQQTPHHKPTCVDKHVYHKGLKVKSKTITINVYNAGAISGLADQTLSALGGKGFRPGVADNAPSGVSATNVTILTSEKQAPQVQLVASQFKGRVAYATGPALAAGIDVVVGNDFVGTNPNAKKYLTLHQPLRTCTSPTRAR
jgi:LytR cell envelope-related transcriptional attenuator